MRVASIDIGTNTILMLIAEVKSNSQFEVISEEFAIARLGEGVDKSGKISDKAAQRAELILHNYKNICDEYNVDIIKTVGTSALRDATNNLEIIDRFQNILKFPVDIISGEEEAYLSFIGTITDDTESLVIDIGGGSTEIISGKSELIKNRISLNIGAVRITEKFFTSQPPDNNSIVAAENFIWDTIQKANLKGIKGKVYAVAGTATTIATASLGLDDNEVASIHNKFLDKSLIDELYYSFKKSTTEQLINNYKISPKRADLITSGTIILKLIMEFLQTDKIIVSAYGLRYGVLKNLIKNIHQIS